MVTGIQMKSKVYILLSVFFLLSFNSIGYDLYAHSLFHYFNYEKITYSYTLFIEYLIIPRYGLLSFIYEFFRDLGIPTGWVALFLVYIPMSQLSNVTFNFVSRKNKIIYTAIAMVLMVLIYFYSALSLVIIWIVACILTGNRLLLIGASFHPAGLILGFFYAVIFPGRLKNFIILLAPILLIALLSFFRSIDLISLTFINVDNIKFDIQIGNILDLLFYVFENKPTESTFLLIIFLISWLNGLRFEKYVIRNSYRQRRFSDSSYRFFLIIPFFILMANSIIREKDSLFLSILKIECSDNVYITWLDFGERDFVGTFNGINNERI
jgi:hypothetical protein